MPFVLARRELLPAWRACWGAVDPEIMSGEPVFTGTRVPVRNLIDYLTTGHTLNDFLKGFPGFKRSQAIAFLEQSSTALLEQATGRRKAA